MSVPVIEPPRVVVGPAPRPDAGAGPPVDVSLIGSPTPTTRRLRVTSTTPVDTIVFAADTRVSAASVGNGTMAAAESVLPDSPGVAPDPRGTDTHRGAVVHRTGGSEPRRRTGWVV